MDPVLPSFDTEKPVRVKQRMRPQSCKAKGRRLQQAAAIALKNAFPFLQGNDVRSISMGAAGDDLILSPAALQVLPYNFEMKNVENLSLWATMEQVLRRYYVQDMGTPTYPCVVLKRNHTDTIGIVPLGHLINRMLGRPEYCPMMSTTHLQTCWDYVSVHCPWAMPAIVHDKRTLNFWATYQAGHALIFNRGNPAYTIFIAMPFSRLIDLWAQSYEADSRLPGLTVVPELPTVWRL